MPGPLGTLAYGPGSLRGAYSLVRCGSLAEAAGETRELQALRDADEGPADAFQRTARHEAANEAVFWREAVVLTQPLAHFDHRLVGHDLAWADFCAGFAEQAVIEGVAQRFFIAVELVLEEGAHDGRSCRARWRGRCG